MAQMSGNSSHCENMTSQEERIRRMQEEILRRAKEDEEITFELVSKNNGVTLHACIMRYEENPAAPTLYLENFLSTDDSEEAIAESAEQLLQFGRSSRSGLQIPAHFFENYKDVVPHLGLRLINFRRNAEILKTAAFVRFEDLAVTFYYLLEDPVMGKGTIRITRDQLQEWKIDVKRLMRDAADNCSRMLPVHFHTMNDVTPEGDAIGKELLMVTNSEGTYGASVILYPRVISIMARALGHDLWILPSSVHEVIVMRDEGEHPEELRMIVREVNRTCVREEEFLSDSVYRYERRGDRIRRVL